MYYQQLPKFLSYISENLYRCYRHIKNLHVLFRRGKIFFGKIPAFSRLFFKVLANTGLHDLADNCTHTCHLQGEGGERAGCKLSV